MVELIWYQFLINMVTFVVQVNLFFFAENKSIDEIRVTDNVKHMLMVKSN